MLRVVRQAEGSESLPFMLMEVLEAYTARVLDKENLLVSSLACVIENVFVDGVKSTPIALLGKGTSSEGTRGCTLDIN